MVKRCFDIYIKYEPNINFILDTCDFSIEDVKEYIKQGYIVIVFGYPNITVDEAVKNTIKYDTELDWTYTESIYRRKICFENYIDESKELEKECRKNNIKFVDTSKNRETELNELFEWLKIKIG